jgi:hypothetical protein
MKPPGFSSRRAAPNVEIVMPSEDDPVTLKEACEIVFRNKITPSTLRAEAARGRLVLSRIGRQDFTTLRDVRAMVAECRVVERQREAPGSNLSEQQRLAAAQAALDRSLKSLRRN